MITTYKLDKIKPIKLSDGTITYDIKSESRSYLFGIVRFNKHIYTQVIDAEIAPNNDNKLKVGFKKPT
jgi:hypothetical protein